MTVTLFVPCFVDLLSPRVAISIVQILERLGHKVEYPEELTCCGQPAFNSGYWDEARAVAGKVLRRLKDAEAVVIASGSCGAMLKVFCPEIFARTHDAEEAKALPFSPIQVVSVVCAEHGQAMREVQQRT